MIDIMAQCPDDASYKAQLNDLAVEGFVFQEAFTPVIYEGHGDQTFWLRLCVTTPSASDDKILNAPLVEFRYSEELAGWTSDGATTSELVRGIHTNFVNQGLPL